MFCFFSYFFLSFHLRRPNPNSHLPSSDLILIIEYITLSNLSHDWNRHGTLRGNLKMGDFGIAKVLSSTQALGELGEPGELLLFGGTWQLFVWHSWIQLSSFGQSSTLAACGQDARLWNLLDSSGFCINMFLVKKPCRRNGFWTCEPRTSANMSRTGHFAGRNLRSFWIFSDGGRKAPLVLGLFLV